MKTELQPESDDEQAQSDEKVSLFTRFRQATTWHLWVGLGIAFVKQLSGWAERETYYLRMYGKVTLGDHVSEVFFTTLMLGAVLAAGLYLLDRVSRRVAAVLPRPGASHNGYVPDPVDSGSPSGVIRSPSGRSSQLCSECGSAGSAAGAKFCAECGSPMGNGGPSPDAGSWQPGPFGRYESRDCDSMQWTDHVANDRGSEDKGSPAPASPDDRARGWRGPYRWQAPVGWRRWCVLGVGLGLLVSGDWFLRNREMAQLLDAVESSEEAMVSANDDIRRAVTEFEGRTYPASTWKGMTFGGEPTQEDYRALATRIRNEASAGAADVIDTSDQVSAVLVLPWHRSVQKAKSRYLDHAGTWEDRFLAVASNSGEINAKRPEIGATFKIAERAFHGALTPFSLFGVEERVEAIFAE